MSFSSDINNFLESIKKGKFNIAVFQLTGYHKLLVLYYEVHLVSLRFMAGTHITKIVKEI